MCLYEDVDCTENHIYVGPTTLVQPLSFLDWAHYGLESGPPSTSYIMTGLPRADIDGLPSSTFLLSPCLASCPVRAAARSPCVLLWYI